MKSEDFKKLVSNGEDQELEFKRDIPQPDLVAKIVAAFLNQAGGRLLLGIGAKGELTGLKNANDAASVLEKSLGTLITPRALWTVEKVESDGKEFLLIEVPQGIDKPYVTNGSIYFRQGGKVIPASRDQIGKMIEDRSTVSQRWERQMLIGADLTDLELDLVQETAEMASNAELWKGNPVKAEDFLHSLGLAAYGGVTNAAMLLFGRVPTRFLPQARVRLVGMPEGKTGNRYTFDKTFDSGLVRIAEQIRTEFMPLIGAKESRFTETSWQRDERVIYPPNAVREGILNALAHRDYSLSGSILISVLPDSLRISNPGKLPDGLTTADLKRNHISAPRNPDIAHVFFLRRFIEKIGRGTQQIVEDCRNSRLRDPKWVSSALETSLTFFPSTGASNLPATSLNERQQKILAVLRQKKLLKAGEVPTVLGGEVTDRTARNDLQSLLDGGWLVRRGRGRSTSYVLSSKGEQT